MPSLFVIRVRYSANGYDPEGIGWLRADGHSYSRPQYAAHFTSETEAQATLWGLEDWWETNEAGLPRYYIEPWEPELYARKEFIRLAQQAEDILNNSNWPNWSDKAISIFSYLQERIEPLRIELPALDYRIHYTDEELVRLYVAKLKAKAAGLQTELDQSC